MIKYSDISNVANFDHESIINCQIIIKVYLLGI